MITCTFGIDLQKLQKVRILFSKSNPIFVLLNLNVGCLNVPFYHSLFFYRLWFYSAKSFPRADKTLLNPFLFY